jgi:hypothetical protein
LSFVLSLSHKENRVMSQLSTGTLAMSSILGAVVRVEGWVGGRARVVTFPGNNPTSKLHRPEDLVPLERVVADIQCRVHTDGTMPLAAQPHTAEVVRELIARLESL